MYHFYLATFLHFQIKSKKAKHINQTTQPTNLDWNHLSPLLRQRSLSSINFILPSKLEILHLPWRFFPPPPLRAISPDIAYSPFTFHNLSRLLNSYNDHLIANIYHFTIRYPCNLQTHHPNPRLSHSETSYTYLSYLSPNDIIFILSLICSNFHNRLYIA